MAIRIEYREVAPEAVSALTALNDYSSRSSIPALLRRLVEVRTSQINGCAYCAHVHRHQALRLGETADRMTALQDWRTSNLFTERERAALAWAEDITLVASSGAPDESYDPLRYLFTDTEIVDLTFIILSMNAWNRLAIAFRRDAPQPGPAREL